MRRLKRERDDFLRAIFDELGALADEEKLEGRARFAGPERLVVDDRVEVRAKTVVVATGAASTIPEALSPVRELVLTNETVFDMDDLPRSIGVVGAGPLGLELAIAFARLGVRTAVFDEADAVAGLKDREVRRVARETFGAELDLKLGVRISTERAPGGAYVRWTGSGGEGEATFERVLAAAGRPPNLKDLDLPAAGVELDDHGIPKFDLQTLRCGDRPVFIAGDASHDRPVLHEAARQGRLAGLKAARLPDVTREPPPAALSIVFTDPDIAQVGQPLAALGAGARVGHCDFNAGRGQIEGRRGGMIRLWAGADGRIAGGEMVGPGVEHIAHLVAFMVQQGMTPAEALALPYYHPTFEEDLRDCLRDLNSASSG